MVIEAFFESASTLDLAGAPARQPQPLSTLPILAGRYASAPMASGGLQQPRARSTRSICFAWLWTALWIAAIYTFASDRFSADDTGRFIEPLLRWLLRGADADWFAAAHFAIRKAAHVAEYAILSLLGLRALRLSFAHPTAWIAASTLALVLVVAALDESRQAHSAQRTGAVADVAIDFAGGVGALVLALAVRRSRSLST